MELLDDAVGSVISAVTVIVHPFVFAIRTLNSMIFGYDETNDNYDMEEQDKEDADLAMTIGDFSLPCIG